MSKGKIQWSLTEFFFFIEANFLELISAILRYFVEQSNSITLLVFCYPHLMLLLYFILTHLEDYKIVIYFDLYTITFQVHWFSRYYE